MIRWFAGMLLELLVASGVVCYATWWPWYGRMALESPWSSVTMEHIIQGIYVPKGRHLGVRRVKLLPC